MAHATTIAARRIRKEYRTFDASRRDPQQQAIARAMIGLASRLGRCGALQSFARNAAFAGRASRQYHLG
jgi:hypothetical protein